MKCGIFFIMLLGKCIELHAMENCATDDITDIFMEPVYEYLERVVDHVDTIVHNIALENDVCGNIIRQQAEKIQDEVCNINKRCMLHKKDKESISKKFDVMYVKEVHGLLIDIHEDLELCDIQFDKIKKFNTSCTGKTIIKHIQRQILELKKNISDHIEHVHGKTIRLYFETNIATRKEIPAVYYKLYKNYVPAQGDNKYSDIILPCVKEAYEPDVDIQNSVINTSIEKIPLKDLRLQILNELKIKLAERGLDTKY